MRRIFVVAALGVLAATPAFAQNPQKGTWEFGAFGRYTWWDKSFSLLNDTRETGWGVGLRLGHFFSPLVSLEFDGSYNWADLDTPLATDVRTKYYPLHLGINFNLPMSDKFSWFLGPRVNYNFYQSDAAEFDGSDWGLGGITGFRLKLNETWSLRLSGTLDYIPSPEVEVDADDKNSMIGVQFGISVMTGRCRDRLDSIRVEPKNQNIMVGDRAGFRVAGFECDGDVIDVTGASTARITSGQGTLTGTSFTATQAGCVDIEVSNPNARQRSTDTARICAQERPAPRVTLDRCELDPATTEVPPGQTVTYKVTAFSSDGTSRELETATLTADAGTVTGRDYATPTLPGTYTVFAQCGEGKAARATVTVKPITITLRAFFEFDSTNVNYAAERDSLRALAETLKRFPNLQLVIYGHTDWIGSIRTNERFGNRRIQAVVDTLATHGIEMARMESWTRVSGGECHPVADNRTSEGRAQNRRVEIYDSRSAPPQPNAQCRDRP